MYLTKVTIHPIGHSLPPVSPQVDSCPSQSGKHAGTKSVAAWRCVCVRAYLDPTICEFSPQSIRDGIDARN